MAHHAIIRIEKHKLGAVSRLQAHHERQKEKYLSNPDIDPARTHLNYHLVQPQGSYREAILECIQTAGAKRRKDSVVMQDGLITASPEWIRGKSDAEQIAFFNYAYAFCEQRYGKENMISAVVHLDEATSHLHFSFVPITAQNRLSSKTVMGGPKGMAKLQDDFHAYMAERYPDLVRGTPKKVTQRQHIPSYLFKQADELFKHYDKICAAIQSIGLVGNGRRKEEAIALLGRYAPEMAQVKNQLTAADKYIRGLERARDRAEQEKTDARQEAAEAWREVNELRDSVFELQYKLKRMQRQIERIPPEVLEQLKEQERQR
ncbi:MAG: plasmid recombination protein, partial [Muribaculaceae bacterium]|nr:plasmid recombination protein [Muribaculaceae bacterium]